jgi:hypothetical protein
LRLRQREHDLRGLFVGLQFGRAEVGLAALGKAKGENGPLLVAEENQRAVATGLASAFAFACDALLDQAAAEIGVGQGTISVIDGRNKRRVTYIFTARKLGEPAILVDTASLLTDDCRHFSITLCIMPQ